MPAGAGFGGGIVAGTIGGGGTAHVQQWQQRQQLQQHDCPGKVDEEEEEGADAEDPQSAPRGASAAA